MSKSRFPLSGWTITSIAQNWNGIVEITAARGLLTLMATAHAGDFAGELASIIFDMACSDGGPHSDVHINDLRGICALAGVPLVRVYNREPTIFSQNDRPAQPDEVWIDYVVH